MNDLHQNSHALRAMIDELLQCEAIGAFRFQVRGRSMQPTLSAGDSVRIVPLEGPPRMGDIVVFPRDTELILHRVVRVRRDVTGGEGRVVTAGDGLGYLDGVIEFGDILGKVEMVENSAGAWSPEDLGRRLTGLLRALLATRPRTRRAVRTIRRSIRRLSGSGVRFE